jgi:hypothetical protein
MKRMYWLLGIMSVICLAWLACADIVRLQDGTVLEGTITEEDAISVTLRLERPDGSIAGKRWVLKSDTAEIHRSSAEEKAARAMELAFAVLQKLRLDTTNSFRLEYYDRTLTNVFRKFLTDYPDSPHAKEVTERIAEWEAERARVASGQVKAQGKWMSAEEVAARAVREAMQQAYQQGIIFLSQTRFGEAAERFEFVIEKSDDTALVQQARQLRLETYQRWVPALEQERRRLADDVKKLEKRVTDAHNAKAQADARLNASPTGGSAAHLQRGGEVTRLGIDSAHAQAFAAASRAGLELQTAETQLAVARREATATEETLARIRPQAAAQGITVAPSGEGIATKTVVAAAPPAASTEPPDTLKSIGEFATNYWVYFLAGAVILIWLISRALGR